MIETAAQTLRRNGEAAPAQTREQLIGRLLANTAKLRRILTDLLDLDRLSRGMMPLDLRCLSLQRLRLRGWTRSVRLGRRAGRGR